MSHFYNKFHHRETLPCDIQNGQPANWPIRLLEIKVRYNKCNCRCKEAKYFVFCMRGIQRGGGGPGSPPWDFFLIFVIIFWLAPLASIIHSVKIWKIRITSKFKRVIPSPVIHTIPGFIYESAISMLISSKITRFYTILTNNFLGKDPHTPPPPVTSLAHFTKLKQSSRMCFTWRERTRDVIFIKCIVCKAVSIAKIDFDHTKAIDTEAPYPLFVCVCMFFCFFFLGGGGVGLSKI